MKQGCCVGLLILFFTLSPLCITSPTEIPAKLLEESERTYNNRIGRLPSGVEIYLYPLLDPCSISPSAILTKKDGESLVVEQPLSRKGQIHLDEIERIPRNKKHELLYQLNLLYREEPGFVKALTLRGKIFLNMRAFQKAESPLLKAIELNPIDFEAYTYLGGSYFNRDILDGARTAYIKSILYNPNNERGWRGLSRLGEKTGFTVQARKIRIGAWMVKVSENEIDLFVDSELRNPHTIGPWTSFITAKAAWVYEGIFQKRYPEAKSYYYTVAEDLYAYDFMLEYWQLIKSRKNVSDPDLDFLLEVKEKDLLPGYILFEEVGPICPETILVQPARMINKIQAYIEEFVLRPDPG